MNGPCVCGATDCASCGPAQGYDLRCQGPAWDAAVEAQMENAIESVVETIMLFGEYPQPRRVGTFITTGSNRPREFDLYEFLEDQKIVEHCDLLEYFILSLNDYGTICQFRDLRDRWNKKITAALTESFKQNPPAFLTEKAAEFVRDEIGE